MLELPPASKECFSETAQIELTSWLGVFEEASGGGLDEQEQRVKDAEVELDKANSNFDKVLSNVDNNVIYDYYQDIISDADGNIVVVPTGRNCYEFYAATLDRDEAVKKYDKEWRRLKEMRQSYEEVEHRISWLEWYKGLTLKDTFREYVRLDGKEAVKFIEGCGYEYNYFVDDAQCSNIFQELYISLKDVFLQWLDGPSKEELALIERRKEIHRRLIALEDMNHRNFRTLGNDSVCKDGLSPKRKEAKLCIEKARKELRELRMKGLT